MTEPADQTQSLPTEQTPRFIRFYIFITALLFFSAVAVIAYRWLVTTEPTAQLIIDGSPALDGAEVEVQSTDDPTKHKSTFGEGDRYSLPFYVDPGTYMIKVTRNGQELIPPREVSLHATSHRAIYRIDLTKWEPKLATSNPASTQPDTSNAPAPAPAPAEKMDSFQISP